ncbi:hypothetical protein K469DRAFT_713831 [Zopfia rhizophila CBS 207.26]|uniref:DUF1446-domain-containing protein n=1 Tax=Zopfia rhizophila CBS 207.26 TaxID=1314779 RepID=A0A6A6DT81_9PEZI|nr:hypothetical protein K469DRAFT_713831 [Zopfia rhizophila CBS 207.26]
MACPKASYIRDLKKLLALAHKRNVPLIFSSAGGDGSDEHVDELIDVIRDIVEGEEGSNRNTKVLAVYSGVSKSTVKERLAAGKIKGCGPPVPTLTNNDIENATRIVAQMGVEAFLDVMRAHPDFDVIVGGRAYDPSPYVAYAAFHTLGATKEPLHALGEEKLGGFFHMGKIMECGAQCATPKSPAARATIYTDGTFDVIPLDSNARCIPVSVAAHTLYEKTRPDLLLGPGGVLDLTKSTYEQLLDQRTVRVRGSLFHSLAVSGSPYTVKLEGAKTRGYRTLTMGAFKDPILTGQIDKFLTRVHNYVTYQHREVDQWWEVALHKFGAWDKEAPGEVWVMCEALAQTQELATSLASTARVACVHGPYPGQKATSGNLAFGMGGLTEIEMGPHAEFCIYHVMDLEVGEEGASERPGRGEMMNGTSHAPEVSDDTKNTIFAYRQFSFGSLDASQAETKGPSNALRPISTEGSERNGTSQSPYSVTKDYLSATEFYLPATIATLGDIAPVLRSKNAGPYEITLDILFPNHSIYNLIKKSGLLTTEKIASLYSLKVEDVIYCGFFDQAWAFKATIPRMRGGNYAISGSFGEEDVHGSQQYLQLMRLELPEALVEKLSEKAVL